MSRFKKGLCTGFTLIELLIAVSIFATIALVLYSCFRGGIISWRRIDSEDIFQQEIRHAAHRMSKDFKNMFFLSNLPFEGTVGGTAFLTIDNLDEDMDTGIGRISYSLLADEEDASSSILIRTVDTLRNALRSGEAEEDALEPDHTAKRVEKLLEGILEIKFSYLLATEINTDPPEIEYEWLDFWDADDALPMGIKVELLVFNKKAKKKMMFSRRVWVPSGKPLKPIPQQTEQE
ncbi:MAG: prepilin-type N-terminal cleavage/methylation domain-containing protein [Candidatus Omnitrophota bacterium]